MLVKREMSLAFEGKSNGFPAVVLLASIIGLSGCNALSGRPTKSEIELSDYDRTCRGGNRYETTCKGAFVLWNGEVSWIGRDYVRTTLNDSLTVDVRDIDPNEQTLVAGQRVRISGWLGDKNIIFPDVAKGRIELLETADEASARNRADEL